MSFEFTLEHFKQAVPTAKNPEDWFEALRKYFEKYEINTPERIAMFLAQCGHESGGFTIMQENLHYRAARLQQIFPKYFRDVDPADYDNNPEAIANRVYANRMGNGDEDSGDGYKYHGRGIVQITGKDNYAKCSQAVFGDDSLVDDPDVLCTVDGAVLSACWFWDSRNLNDPSDEEDIVTVTKKINGGTNGLDDRTAMYNKILPILQD
jgi:putative chitinase